jgi:hypothetical protein
MRPVALDRYFPKLSKNMKFTRFGLANLKWLNFKVEAVLQFITNLFNRICKMGRRETKRAERFENARGQPN